VTAIVTGAIALGVHEVAVLLPAVAVCTWAAALHVRNDDDVTVAISLAILATYAGIGVGQLWAPLAAVAVCWGIATALDVASPERADIVRVGDVARAALL